MGKKLIFVSETEARELVTLDEARDAIERMFLALHHDSAVAFPVVRERLAALNAVFGVKSGYDHTIGGLGLKAGGYWTGNAARGIGNHQSTTLLFDPETGQASALVGANYLTAVRTAAASALATQRLARADAEVIGIVGPGTQALHQLDAISRLFPGRAIAAWGRSPEKVEAFVARARQSGHNARAASLENTLASADIIVTTTSGAEPIVPRRWIKRGAHINAVGADTKGKQELDPAIVAEALVVVDSVEQALSIGECQHAFTKGLAPRDHFERTLGAVLAGDIPGRGSRDDITLFDSTGLGLQDVVMAALVGRKARALGKGVEVSWD